MQVLDSILLVDDDQAANFFHKSLIQKLGITEEIYEALNGKAAINHIERIYRSHRQLPSLVLIDIEMPVMDGIQLIKQLKTSELLAVNKIPLAIVASSQNLHDRNEIDKLGNYTYVSKPLNEVKLFNILKNEVVPRLQSEEKRNFINEMDLIINRRLEFLKVQNLELRIKREEIAKYRKEVSEKINRLKDSF